MIEPFPWGYFSFSCVFFFFLSIFKSGRNGRKTANGLSVTEKTGFISKSLNNLGRKVLYKIIKSE